MKRFKVHTQSFSFLLFFNYKASRIFHHVPIFNAVSIETNFHFGRHNCILRLSVADFSCTVGRRLLTFTDCNQNSTSFSLITEMEGKKGLD